jgi:hypothetical protein
MDEWKSNVLLHATVNYDKLSPNILICYRKGKPIARWGRKVMDLNGVSDRQTAEGIPFGSFCLCRKPIFRNFVYTSNAQAGDIGQALDGVSTRMSCAFARACGLDKTHLFFDLGEN